MLSFSCPGEELACSSGGELDPGGRMLECHWLGEKQVDQELGHQIRI